MLKLKTFLILLVSIGLFTLILTMHSFYKEYQQHQIPLNNQQNIIKNDTQNIRVQKLKMKSKIPFLGYQYIQQLLQELIIKKRFQQINQITKQAVLSLTNSHSYKIWYYKAMAQCSLLKFQQCRKSLYQAQFLAPNNFSPKMLKLKKIFNYHIDKTLKNRFKQLLTL